MYAAPPSITATTIARVPDEYHVHGRVSGRYESRTLYIEGPSLARDGTLYFTDIPGGRIFSWRAGGDVELLVEYDGEPNGTKVHRDGRLWVADNKNGILTVDPATGIIEVICDRVANERLRGPNDLTFAMNGDLYFTDQGNSDIQRPHGRVVRRRANGETELVLEDIPSPNGLVLSPDEAFLYVAVTRTNAVWKAPLTVPPGLVPTVPMGTTGVFVQMSGGIGPDGMAVDEAGNIAVAHTGMGCAWLFSALGEPVLRINSSAGLSVSNMVYGGPENRTLYLTESSTGSIMTAELPVPGQRLYADPDPDPGAGAS